MFAETFFSVRMLKKVYRYIGYYKINTLHLHLTDGIRAAYRNFKSWPKLYRELAPRTEVVVAQVDLHQERLQRKLVTFTPPKIL